MPTVTYPLDVTGQASSNLVSNETQVLTVVNGGAYRLVIPDFAPFYLDNLSVTFVDGSGQFIPLTEGVDFIPALWFVGASRSTGKMLYGGISVASQFINGTIRITYQTLGGSWCGDRQYVLGQLAERVFNPRITVWDMVTNVQEVFPPTVHNFDVETTMGQDELVAKLNDIVQAIANSPNDLGTLMQILAVANGKQNLLIAGQNIKTINGQSPLGSGNIVVSGGEGLTFKTINGQSITGTGNITIAGGTGGSGGYGGVSKFVSDPIAYISGNEYNISYTHGFGQVPDATRLYVKCITADGGYSVGDYIDIGGMFGESTNSNSTFKLCNTWSNATQFGLVIYDTWHDQWPKKDASGTFQPTNGCWELYAEAILDSGSGVVGRVYESSGVLLSTAAGVGFNLTYPHSLGVVPDVTSISIVCLSDDQGYSVDDVVNGEFMFAVNDGGSPSGALTTVWADATNVGVKSKNFYNSNSSVQIANKTTGIPESLDTSKWELRVKAVSFGAAPVPETKTINGTSILGTGNIDIGTAVGAVYTSPGVVISSMDDIVDYSHGLGVNPDFVEVYLECISTDSGYSVGDIVDGKSVLFGTTVSDPDVAFSDIWYNQTTVGVRIKPFRADSNLMIPHKTDFPVNYGYIFQSKWKLFVKAVKLGSLEPTTVPQMTAGGVGALANIQVTLGGIGIASGGTFNTTGGQCFLASPEGSVVSVSPIAGGQVWRNLGPTYPSGGTYNVLAQRVS